MAELPDFSRMTKDLMNEEILQLGELWAKAKDGDFLRSAAEAVVQYS
jgi:hypothetical protein